MDIFKRIEYCPPNVTIQDIWVNHGLSHCFFDTVSSSVIAAFIVIAGTIQMIIYRRYGARIEDLSQITASKLYYLQIFLLALVPSVSVLRFVLEAFIFADAHLYGYAVRVFKRSGPPIILNPNKFHFTISFTRFVDCCFIIDLHFIPILNMVGVERTLLSTPIDANTRAWPRTVDILVDGFHQRKFFGYELGERRLVGSCVR